MTNQSTNDGGHARVHLGLTFQTGASWHVIGFFCPRSSALNCRGNGSEPSAFNPDRLIRKSYENIRPRRDLVRRLQRCTEYAVLTAEFSTIDWVFGFA